MKNESVKQLSIHKFSESLLKVADDIVAVEEPLEIAILTSSSHKKPISITMRTPGQDKELAVGFLYTEGIIQNAGQIEVVQQISDNEIVVVLKNDEAIDLSKIERHFYTNSSCGVCGKSSIDQLRSVNPSHKVASNIKISPKVLTELNQIVRQTQTVFESTGGIHASALFSTSGELQCLFEDVGRHNALDKLVGHAVLNHHLPLEHNVLFLSGRASFELIQKAAMAGIPIICALGAPSSMAIELANEFDITLIGFLKIHSFNVYSRADRLLIL
jgi:FdhD protein